ncbi:MAG: gliding motility-associated C-terminal domain-containing protein, partial [Bacteroidales bacterium]
CEGESTTLTATMQGNYQWNSSDTTQSISFTPTIDSLYIVKVIDSAGCLNYASKMVRVHPHYNGLIVFDTVCDNYVYDAQGTIITESGTYNLNLISTYGCDSNIVLNLTINPTFYDTSFAVICDNDEFLFQGLVVDSSGTYQVNYNNIYGCDSIYVLHLVVNQTFNDTIYADIYYGNVYKENGFNERTTGFYTHAYQTINGCDSVLNLDLQVDRILFPNVVTPNGDGINDVFNIHNLIEQKAFPDNELFVYNRQGKLIYRFKNISKEEDLWSPSQTNSPTGTYFYRFMGKRHDKTIDLMGAIEVLR